MVIVYGNVHKSYGHRILAAEQIVPTFLEPKPTKWQSIVIITLRHNSKIIDQMEWQK